MALVEKLQSDLKDAMKSGDTLGRETLRMALADVKNKRIELGRDLEDEDVLAVLTKAVKSRTDSAEQYADAGRKDLEDRERAEIVVLERYLPEQLSEDETRELVAGIISDLGLTQKSELGQVMKAVMAEHRGKVDGKAVQRIAAELLG